jgi:hypothetical protein
MMIRLFFTSGCENFSITLSSFFSFFFSHRAPPCSAPQWAWGAYLAGEHASPTSVFGLVVGGGGEWKWPRKIAGSGCGEILMDRRGEEVGEGVEKDGEREYPRDGCDSRSVYCASHSGCVWRGLV